MNSARSSSRRGFLSMFTVGIVGLASLGLACQRQAPPTPKAPAAPFRRIVTGFNTAGKSIITHDGPVPLAAQDCCSEAQIARAPYLRGVSANEIWLFDSVPADLAKTADPLTGKLPEGNQSAKGGITTRIVRYEPGVAYPMHTTSTVDLGIVITGSLRLELEEGSTVVGPGEVVVQRGTPHAWRVVGDQPVVVVFVLVDAINGRSLRPAP